MQIREERRKPWERGGSGSGSQSQKGGAMR